MLKFNSFSTRFVPKEGDDIKMANHNLENLLTMYEQKRRKANLDLEDRIRQLYREFPEFEEIERKINQKAIEKTKAILNNKQDLSQLSLEIDNLKNEKREFLEKAKIDITLLEPHYDCKICKDTGYIKNNIGKSIICSCLKQKLLDVSYNQSNLSDIKRENFDVFDISKFSDEINIEKYKRKISPRKNINNIKNASLKFIENFDNLDQKNLFFVGNTGLGKTYMTNCIANEILKKGKTVLYQTAPVLFETIISNKFNRNKISNSEDFYRNVLTVDLLIIDDLGTENINTMTISELFTILNTRILNLNNKSTKTIISTNLSIEQIFEFYEERIGSRIAGYYDIYHFFGDDLRLKKLIH